MECVRPRAGKMTMASDDDLESNDFEAFVDSSQWEQIERGEREMEHGKL
jgi:hypothetical protein